MIILVRPVEAPMLEPSALAKSGPNLEPTRAPIRAPVTANTSTWTDWLAVPRSNQPRPNATVGPTSTKSSAPPPSASVIWPTVVGQMTLALGGGALLFVLVGPTVAFGLGWLLRGTANQSVHVLVFAVTGALIGALVGSRFGPDFASALGSSMGASTGLTRMIMSRYGRV